MQAIILKSKPGTRFRFGEALGAYTEESNNAQKTTSEYLHSDTLWSALVNAWALACPGSLENFLLACNTGKFKLSSAYYYVEYKGNNVFFLPKPVSLNLFKITKPKRLKRIKFISKGIWEQGILPDDWFDSGKCTLLQNESIVALKTEISEHIKLFEIVTNHKNRARDVSNREDAFYYETDLYLLSEESFKTDWYFLIENNLKEDLISDFRKAMQTLTHFGIGGERTSGCGSLTDFCEVNYSLDITDFKYNASVSLIAPDENALTENSFYQVIKRGGRFIEKGKCLPMIQMLLEGAVLETYIRGRILSLNDEPPILRYGLNLAIPVHNNFINNVL
jgi:CRISPR-associated protein Csm4